MAARRKVTSLKSQSSIEEMNPVTVWNEPAVKTNTIKTQTKFPKWLLVLGAVVLAVCVWWWRTNTWPVVAMVGSRPITRFEIEQNLFKQYGRDTVEGLVTQYQIEAELNKQNIKVDVKAIDARVEEIKKSLGPGQELDKELASRGMDMGKFRNLIELQLRLNKAVEGKASVSAEQVTEYVKKNGEYLTGKTDADKRTEAEQAIKQDSLNGEIEKWVAEAKKSIGAWRLYPEPTVPAGTSGQPQVTQ